MDHSVNLHVAIYSLVFFQLNRSSAAADASCGTPGRPVDGWYIPMHNTPVYAPGSEIQYFCDLKHLLFGPSKRVCLDNGSWNGTIPLCEQPISVQSALQSTLLEGHSAMLALDGSYSTCSNSDYQEKAYWTAFLAEKSTVQAVRITLPQGLYANLEVLVKKEDSAEITCGKYSGIPDMSKVTRVFYCPPNTGSQMVHVRDHMDIKHYFQLCEVEIFVKKDMPCLNPDIPNNGYGNKRSSGSVTTFHYFCSGGFKLIGANESICQPNGTWSPPAPVCTPIACEPPESLQSGKTSYQATDGTVPFGGVATYSCNPGFELQGDATRQCIQKNKWSGIPPVCVAKECDAPLPPVANGHLMAGTTSVHSEALLHCNRGYRALKADRLVCLPSGRWSTDVVMCVPVQCEEIRSVPHGSVRLLDKSTFYGSLLQVTCDPGYTIQGPSVKKCLDDGTWENLTNACNEVLCDIYLLEKTLTGGEWIPVFRSALPKPGAAMMLKCHSGFQVTGTPPTTTCLLDGTWAATSAKCIKMDEVAADTWRGKWSPSVMIIAAISAGVGTAVCILCVVAIGLMLKKRHHLRSNTSVFHVGKTVGLEEHRDYLASTEEHYYNTALYDEVSEAKNPPVQPRKPYSPLPIPPLETEPCYAQPFETRSNYSLKPCKRNVRDYCEASHIYAEPVCSYRFSNGQSRHLCGISDWREKLETTYPGQENGIYEKLEEIRSSHSNEDPSNFLLVSNKYNEAPILQDKLMTNAIYVPSLQSVLSNEALSSMSSMNHDVKMVDNAIFPSDSDSSV